MKLFLIAGEPSGDKLGAALMAGLKSLHSGVEFYGVGGPLMQAEGLTSLFPMEELSVMGLAEVLPKYFALKRRIAQAAQAVIQIKAEAVITIDSPDFCLRVAKIVKANRPDFPTIHYVAPSVWAWRAGRAAKMARVIDHVLALLPFEPPLMQAAGMTCDFVGHPVVAEPQATPAQALAFRKTHGIGPSAPLVLALPGSRRGEISRLAPTFGQSLAPLAAAHPDLAVVLPTLPHLVDPLTALVADWPVTPVLLHSDPDAKRAAFVAADIALAASGTVSLELAAARTPMVIAYDMNPISRAIISRLLKVDTVTLVNLVSETRTIPEFIGPHCRADLIAPALTQLLDAPQAQSEAMAVTLHRLGQNDAAPGVRAARSVLAALGSVPHSAMRSE